MPEANHSRHVLVVDDDRSVGTLIETILTRHGFVVEVVQNGEEAIEVMGASTFDAIVLDLMMPKVDGFGVIEHLGLTAPAILREDVIVLTAASARDLQRLDASRVFRVLRKPFNLDELVATVTAACVNGNGGH